MKRLPYVGIGFGFALNGLGLVFNRPGLIATGANVLWVSGLALGQRHRNRRNGRG